MTDRHHALISIASKALSADIDAMGSQLFALRDAQGRDLLWNGDPKFWTGRAPILFPIIGMLVDGQYRLDGVAYHLEKHGFARRKPFDLIAQTDHAATFRLTADEDTLKAYPFHFQLDIRFAIQDATLTMTASVKNVGDKTMFASFGFHPAFRWPLPYGGARADHKVTFEHDEPAPIRRINAKGVVKPQDVPTPVDGRKLVLHDELFVDDALIFDRIKSQKLRYGAGDGPHLNIEFPDTPYLGIWTKPGADFVCIEPWHGIADAEGFHGDFKDKRGVFSLEPSQTHRCMMTIEVVG